MELEIVFLSSLVGSLVTVFLLLDAWEDRRLVLRDHFDDEALKELTRHRLVAEILRLLVQLMLLITAIFVMSDHPKLREVSLTFLVAVPIILATSSIYSFVRRRRLLD